jgi:hypothetical protein
LCILLFSLKPFCYNNVDNLPNAMGNFFARLRRAAVEVDWWAGWPAAIQPTNPLQPLRGEQSEQLAHGIYLLI